MIKEIEIDGENIIIDFDGAPFWKYYVIQAVMFVRFGKLMVDFIETE